MTPISYNPHLPAQPHEAQGAPHLTPSSLGSLTNDRGLQVYKHCPGHVLASARLTEEGVEGVVPSPNGLVTGHLAIGLDAMLQAVQLPAGIANLDTSLADVDGDALTLGKERRKIREALRKTLRNDSHRSD